MGYYSPIHIKYRNGSTEFRAVLPIEFRIENTPRDIIEWALPRAGLV